jgi:hypothetical protein
MGASALTLKASLAAAESPSQRKVAKLPVKSTGATSAAAKLMGRTSAFFEANVELTNKATAESESKERMIFDFFSAI